eukprot:scpid111856/ scgid1074/ 
MVGDTKSLPTLVAERVDCMVGSYHSSSLLELFTCPTALHSPIALHSLYSAQLDAKYQQEAAPGIGLGLGFDRPRSLLRNLSPRSLRQNKRKNKKLESWKVSA